MLLNKKTKKLRKVTPKVNVNLGCGSHIIPGWINIDDYVLADKDFLRGDAREIPLESNSVDYLLCDNVLEHIAMMDVPMVLYEIRRVLKRGGRAVIIVPDFRSAVNQWLAIEHDRNFNPIIYQYLSEVIYGNQNHEGEFHRVAMSPGFLHYNLSMVGLKNHELVMYKEFAPIPEYPGVRDSGKNAKCRNAQLVADITKTA